MRDWPGACYGKARAERSEVLEGITPFQHLSLEHREFLTWINSDENRGSVRKGDKHVYLQCTFMLLV